MVSISMGRKTNNSKISMLEDDNINVVVDDVTHSVNENDENENENKDEDEDEDEDNNIVDVNHNINENDVDMDLDMDYTQFSVILRNKAHEMLPKSKEYITYAYSVSSIYLFWITMHYIAARLYTYYCVPTSVTGFIASPFLVSSPHCKALRWVFHHGGNTIDAMWVIIGTWLCSKIILK
jgi:hypothetical protein